MAGARRKRTDEEQKIYDEIEAIKRARTDKADEITKHLDAMWLVPPTNVTDVVLGGYARHALTARHELDALTARLEALMAHYQALRARPTEDVPL